MLSWHSRAKRFYFFSLFLSPQPPPTYEESIRQSVEVPYNIFPSCLGISPPQNIYTGSDTPNPVSSDSTFLPVWHWSSASDAQWRKDFGSFTTGGGTRLKGFSDWSWLDLSHKLIHTTLMDLQSRDKTVNDGATKEEHSGKDTFSWARLNVRRLVSEETHWMQTLTRWLVHLRENRVMTFCKGSIIFIS